MHLTQPTCSTPSVLSLIPCLLHCTQSKQRAIRLEVQHQWRWEQPGLRMLPIRQVNATHVAADAWHEVHFLLAFAQLAQDSLSVLQSQRYNGVLEALLCITQQPSCKFFCQVSFCCAADDTSHDPSNMREACGCNTAFQSCH